MMNRDYLCPGCTDYFDSANVHPDACCATCGVQCCIELRVYHAAAFDEQGNAIDLRHDDLKAYDTTEDRAIELAEQTCPTWRKLTGIEIRPSAFHMLADACEAYDCYEDSALNCPDVGMLHMRVYDASEMCVMPQPRLCPIV
jgi:hypothetical protein